MIGAILAGKTEKVRFGNLSVSVAFSGLSSDSDLQVGDPVARRRFRMSNLRTFLEGLKFRSPDIAEETYKKLSTEQVQFNQLESITDEEFEEIGITSEVIHVLRSGLEALKRQVIGWLLLEKQR